MDVRAARVQPAVEVKSGSIFTVLRGAGLVLVIVMSCRPSASFAQPQVPVVSITGVIDTVTTAGGNLFDANFLDACTGIGRNDPGCTGENDYTGVPANSNCNHPG